MPSSEPKLSGSLAVLVPAFRCAGLDEALAELLAPALVKGGLAPDGVAAVLDAVRQRERAGSTDLGSVALPHARVPGLHGIVAGLGVNAEGVFVGRPGTTFVLAFATPANAAADHLRFLARAAQLFRDEAAGARLLAARSAEEMLAAVRAAET